MRGEFRRVQAIIVEDYPKALYIHCASHCLHLCLNDSSKTSCIRIAFDVMSEHSGAETAKHVGWKGTKQFPFLKCSVPKKMLSLICSLSQFLQSKSIDLSTAVSQVELGDVRINNDEEFEKNFRNASGLVDVIGVVPTFPKMCRQTETSRKLPSKFTRGVL
ncbi:hypothetical protein PR048_006440 [Dryococelus australis]|uniref:DUF4371 domain-containing protein n=1 Tax=Dryococelus australis TaxID=614101 RepID=A0ABQ9IAZ3_9NEOP|nr:hypothetical protein PR048_006440 [Dryococelus australis]